MSRIRANLITNQSADGAPTVQNGLVISGVTTSTNVSVASSVTATTYYGSGTNLTGLSGVSVANQADNRLLTATGTTDALNGETNLTFDGNNLAMSGTGVFTLTRNSRTLTLEGNYGNEGHPAIKTSTGHDLRIFTNGNNEKLRILANGGVGINTSNFSGSLNNEVGLAIHGSSNDNCRITLTTPTKSYRPSAIGYFGLNRFGIDTHHGLEIRDAAASYATRFKIDNNGYLTLPNTPVASAYVASSSPGASNNKIQNAVLGLNTVHFNNGGHFNTSNYRFTCPVTGYYKVSYSTNLHTSNLNEGMNYQVNTRVNGSVRHIHYGTKESSVTWIYISFAETISCNANDYIDLVLNGSDTLGVDSSSAWNRATFELIG